MKLAATLLTLALAAFAARAQPVYRCGSVYSQTPCPQGRIVEATDPRTAAQRAEARRMAADERQLATDMRRDRLTDQAAVKPAAASSLSGPAPAQPASAAERGHAKKKKHASAKPSATTDFTALDPSSRKHGKRK